MASASIASSEAVYDPKTDPKRKAKSNDPGLKYGFWPVIGNRDLVQCSLCDRKVSGGIKRFKEYLVGGFGDVKKCAKTTTTIMKETREALWKYKKGRPLFLDYDDRGEDEDVSATTTDKESQASVVQPNSRTADMLDDKQSKDNSGDKDNRNLQPENTLSEGGNPWVSEDLEGPPSSSRAYEPSSSGQGNKSSDCSTPESAVSGKLHSATEYVNSSQRPGSSTSSTSERVAITSAASAPGLSPSSSMGSLRSEKSSLNPNAKEFKLNPNAKSFTPSAPLRPPHPPASDGPYYYSNNMPTAPLGPGLPVGMGYPPVYGGQPIVYNAQPGPSPQGYMHPSGPQYGQQMMIGQTRPVYYYAPEMPQYRGRNF